jgi:threonyl-tRNA synthetase
MLIVGEKEAENNQVSIRKQGEGDMGVLSVQDFATKVKEEVEAMMTVC